MSGGSAVSRDDKNKPEAVEEVVKDDLNDLVIYENGVAVGPCRNSLLCGEMARLDPITLMRRLCDLCFRLFRRAFIFCTMKNECNVCLEPDKVGLMYTCNGNHKVCTDCFRETLTKPVAHKKLKRCFLCKIGTIHGDQFDGRDPMDSP